MLKLTHFLLVTAVLLFAARFAKPSAFPNMRLRSRTRMP